MRFKHDMQICINKIYAAVIELFFRTSSNDVCCDFINSGDRVVLL